jgi:Domain of unknown function (DUF6916)
MINALPGCRREFLMQLAAIVPASLLGIEVASVRAADAAEPLDLKKLSMAKFQPLTGQDFRLEGPNGPVPLVLEKVKDMRCKNDKHRPGDVRTDPFLLLFLSKNFERLPADIYRLSNSKLGAFDVYLNEVCADDDPATVHFAVVFN